MVTAADAEFPLASPQSTLTHLTSDALPSLPAETVLRFNQWYEAQKLNRAGQTMEPREQREQRPEVNTSCQVSPLREVIFTSRGIEGRCDAPLTK